MKLYKVASGIIIEFNGNYHYMESDWDDFINNDNLYVDVLSIANKLPVLQDTNEKIKKELLPPIGSQEIWASGVTYLRSKSARMEESKDAGGGDFYDKVYDAERPELFFKSAAYRAKGPGGKVRIRRDSTWNVPEPELTLMITSSGKIIGCTIGNDMSSRDIEGQNPLYLPQAKTYDGSTAIGPCIFVTEEPLSPQTRIVMNINRRGEGVFSGEVQINQIKREFTELVEFLFRETSFPAGCLLMTGTGIVPPNDFTLQTGDEIRIRIEPIGELVNVVE